MSDKLQMNLNIKLIACALVVGIGLGVVAGLAAGLVGLSGMGGVAFVVSFSVSMAIMANGNVLEYNSQ